MSGTTACRAVSLKAAAIPIMKVTTIRTHSCPWPAHMADAQVHDAAERGLDQADERPCPLGQVAHLRGPRDVGQAEGIKADGQSQAKRDWPALRVGMHTQQRDEAHHDDEPDKEPEERAGRNIGRPDPYGACPPLRVSGAPGTGSRGSAQPRESIERRIG